MIGLLWVVMAGLLRVCVGCLCLARMARMLFWRLLSFLRWWFRGGVFCIRLTS
nr:MAG TPA: hypothetical protein [Caudoviricetes sp.]